MVNVCQKVISTTSTNPSEVTRMRMRMMIIMMMIPITITVSLWVPPGIYIHPEKISVNNPTCLLYNNHAGNCWLSPKIKIFVFYKYIVRSKKVIPIEALINSLIFFLILLRNSNRKRKKKS